jgi:hypothetical protein
MARVGGGSAWLQLHARSHADARCSDPTRYWRAERSRSGVRLVRKGRGERGGIPCPRLAMERTRSAISAPNHSIDPHGAAYRSEANIQSTAWANESAISLLLYVAPSSCHCLGRPSSRPVPFRRARRLTHPCFPELTQGAASESGATRYVEERRATLPRQEGRPR